MLLWISLSICRWLVSLVFQGFVNHCDTLFLPLDDVIELPIDVVHLVVHLADFFNYLSPLLSEQSTVSVDFATVMLRGNPIAET